MTWIAIKQALYAICIGTAVTFLTSLLQLAIGLLNGDADNLLGGAAGAAAALTIKTRHVV